jgi:hypothetical protein
MFTFLPLLLVVLAILIAAVIAAQNAAPLGAHPYRWGLFVGIATAAQSVSSSLRLHRRSPAASSRSP